MKKDILDYSDCQPFEKCNIRDVLPGYMRVFSPEADLSNFSFRGDLFDGIELFSKDGSRGYVFTHSTQRDQEKTMMRIRGDYLSTEKIKLLRSVTDHHSRISSFSWRLI